MTEAKTYPQVVVACAWYNRVDYIRDTVDSLLAQDFESFEIVLVNDGSPDPRVREILDSYSDPRLRVIHQENTGFIGAIQRAIEASNAPFIAIQGAGDVSFPSRLREQFSFLKKNEKVVGVDSRRLTRCVSGKDKEVRVDGRARWLKNIDFLGPGSTVEHSGIMFRRSDYEVVGGYRLVFRYGQDLDLWIRMSERGDFVVIDSVLYERRIFSDDGVEADTTKKLLQSKLHFFARRCAWDRMKYGFDLVDVFGEHAVFFARREAGYAKMLAKNALKQLFFEHMLSARLLSILSLREQVTLLGILAFVGVQLARSSVGLLFVRKLIAKKGFLDKRQFKPLIPD